MALGLACPLWDAGGGVSLSLPSLAHTKALVLSECSVGPSLGCPFPKSQPRSIFHRAASTTGCCLVSCSHHAGSLNQSRPPTYLSLLHPDSFSPPALVPAVISSRQGVQERAVMGGLSQYLSPREKGSLRLLSFCAIPVFPNCFHCGLGGPCVLCQRSATGKISSYHISWVSGSGCRDGAM